MPNSVSTRLKNSPKRIAILSAATEQFVNSGFDGTSMDKIAEFAKVSKATVYNHFPSKDDLFQAILDALIDKIGSMRAVPYYSTESLEKQLHAIGRIFAETVTSPDFMKLSKVAISRFILAPEWAQRAHVQQAKLRANLIEWIRAANIDGRLNVADPEKAAAQYCGLIKEDIFWPELIWGQATASTAAREISVQNATTFFLDHFKNSIHTSQ